MKWCRSAGSAADAEALADLLRDSVLRRVQFQLLDQVSVEVRSWEHSRQPATFLRRLVSLLHHLSAPHSAVVFTSVKMRLSFR